jgi:hypothetical protein
MLASGVRAELRDNAGRELDRALVLLARLGEVRLACVPAANLVARHRALCAIRDDESDWKLPESDMEEFFVHAAAPTMKV